MINETRKLVKVYI